MQVPRLRFPDANLVPPIPDLDQFVGAVSVVLAFPAAMELHLPSVGKQILRPPIRRAIIKALREVADHLEAQDEDDLEDALASLAGLEDGWDEEGAPRPSPEAIARSRAVLHAIRDDLDDATASVEPDVIGGVAILLEADDRQVWIACMNSGATTVAVSQGIRVVFHAAWDSETAARALAILHGKGAAA